MTNELTKERWQAIAEKLAEYLDRMCDCVDSDLCYLCPLYHCEASVGNISKFAIYKAKKELGYE